MTSASCRGLLCRLSPSEPDLPNGRPATVASLGLPVRLVAVDAEPERRLKVWERTGDVCVVCELLTHEACALAKTRDDHHRAAQAKQ
ncbi:hypothetical protein [Microvirga sp. KLBC 81]|uniref:hypothetical protein n=1 Tax=Microvirga sp. KLBC 81 TaxID=1862707 RepID=UPI001057B737|nr:hypothetical protein [Microvirga sp. KLBC 81]